MGTSIELKKRELAELKKKSDKLKAEIKADDERNGKHLDLTCFEFTDAEIHVLVKLNVSPTAGLYIAKTEIKRVKRFFDILAERYPV